MQKTNKARNIGLWIVQLLLGILFILAGIMKASLSIESLSESLPWVTESPLALVKFIGISELLGGIGLILPSILRYKPKLTVWAAIGIVVIMFLAAGFHASRGEFEAIFINLIIAGLAAFIAWGRSRKTPGNSNA